MACLLQCCCARRTAARTASCFNQPGHDDLHPDVGLHKSSTRRLCTRVPQHDVFSLYTFDLNPVSHHLSWRRRLYSRVHRWTLNSAFKCNLLIGVLACEACKTSMCTSHSRHDGVCNSQACHGVRRKSMKDTCYSAESIAQSCATVLLKAGTRCGDKQLLRADICKLISLQRADTYATCAALLTSPHKADAYPLRRTFRDYHHHASLFSLR